MLIFIFLDLCQEGVDELVFWETFQDFSFAEEEAAAFSGGYAKVRFSRFSGTIDSAAHDGDAEGGFELFEFFFYFLRHVDEVYLGAAAGGAGDEDRAVLLDAESGEDFFSCAHFF